MFRYGPDGGHRNLPLRFIGHAVNNRRAAHLSHGSNIALYGCK
ncbi:hypothetical protein [Azospirillum argentinense]